MTARAQSNPSASSSPGESRFEAIAEAVLSAVMGMIFQAAQPYLRLLGAWLAWRFLGVITAALATAWAAIGLTLALHEVAPLWAAFLGVSGLLALGAVIAFTVTPEGRNLSPGNSKPVKKE
ncbi:MAG: hypothetical protein RLW87_23425 [Alphaproteobacteria bacterium]|jgi:hypothetical protein|uniref:hypothetical protein n=1 Tax=Pacificispira sp. TaxID=2888761 RepID=UPI001AFFD1AF|nr:hypothetical protein [Alphaproteobacteria bacterium]MBO6862458.1 hypothetical protein [Alphaproteobacteria bacterium]